MAVMGVQLVVSLLMASIMQKMAPHFSFARWILCSGRLFRYRHPTEEELFALAGKQKPKARRERGVTDDKPLSVPRDIDLQLESSPITPVDALVLRYFLEYQWYVDFAVYSTFVYLFTEGYYCLVDPRKEANISLLWCLLTVFFSIKIFFMVMRHYFKSEEGGERSVCLSFAFFFLLIAMVVLIVREDYLEFGLDTGLTDVYDNLEVFLKEQAWEWTIPVTKLGIKLGLVAVCSFIGACLTFPGLRLAQTHLDALKLAADRPVMQLCPLKTPATVAGETSGEKATGTWPYSPETPQHPSDSGHENLQECRLLLHASFLAPVIIVLLWVKPISRDLLLQAPLGKETVQILSDAAFNSFRLWAIVVLCLLRLAMIHLHLQAYLNLAPRWVEQMKREAGRIGVVEIQQRITRIYCYVTVVSLQYLAPVILTLHCVLLLKTLGNYSWGLYPEPALMSPAVDAAPVLQLPLTDASGEDVQAAVEQITGALGALGTVFTPLFYRGLLSFLTWWVAACQIVSSLFGLYFHQYLAAS